MDLKQPVILGRTGLPVSRLGLASGYGISAAGIERAFREFGINYFFWSTPRKEGMEQGVRSLARTERDRIVIALQTYDHTGLFIGRSVDQGLRDLGIEYADVLILGWHNSLPWERVMTQAQSLKERGKVRYIGMSGHNRKAFGALAQDPDNPIDVFMARYNAVHPGAETDIFPFLPETNRPGVTIYTATAWRKLLKKAKMPPGEEPLAAVDCYRFVLSNPHVDCCLMGPASEGQMDEGLAALAKGPLSVAEMARIRKIGRYIHD